MGRSSLLAAVLLLVAGLLVSELPAGEESCCTCDASQYCRRAGLCSEVDLGGWISSGVYANACGADDSGAVGSPAIGDGFTVRQMWLYAEKAVDTEGHGWDWGGRIDGNFGTDTPDMQAFGDGTWDDPWDTSADYGFAMPQLYGEIGCGDLTVKVGRFLTLIGWEYVQDPPNFFASNSYSYFYGEPATHTGVLGSYAASDRLTIHAGWTNGWDAGFSDRGGGSTFLGGVVWSADDDVELTYTCSAGTLGIGKGDLYMHSLAVELGLTERLTWIMHNDLGVQTDRAAGAALWVGVVNYLQYQLSDTVGVGLRGEWFQDRDGVRVDPGVVAGNFYEVTLGLDWHPSDWFIIRPEIRYDWFDGTAAPGNRPFAGGTQNDQFSGGLDLIVTF